MRRLAWLIIIASAVGNSALAQVAAPPDSLSNWPTANTVLKLADPNANKLVMWDDALNKYAFVTLGTNLSFSGTTLNATGAGGSGTVTNTGGNLTNNALVLGAGTVDTKVAAGLTTDGTSALTLGVAGTSVGSIDFKNATSGTVTLAPVTGALGSNTVSLPAATGTVALSGANSDITSMSGLTGIITDTQTNTGVADGIILQNITAAAAGVQEHPPYIHFIGQGWKTNTGGASQTVDWRVGVLNIQGATNPNGRFTISAQTNGGGYSNDLTIDGTSGNAVFLGTVAFSNTTKGIVGTATNDNAIAGGVGEFASATIATGSSVTLTTNTVANVTSTTLTAGDWDVIGVVDYTFGATTSYTMLQQGISTSTAALGAQDTFTSEVSAANVPTAASDMALNTPTTRISISSTTTVFLVAKATFTVSTLKAYGTIRARRMR